jgi:hypothetical protein
MENLSISTRVATPLLEESQKLIQEICLNGCDTDDEIQQIVASHLDPHNEELLALPKTNTFSETSPRRSMVHWALGHESYSLLRYLIHNEWNVNGWEDGTSRCASILGCFFS